MNSFDRIHDLHKILKDRRTAIPLEDILQQMECSRATFNRVKRHMTEFMGAPISYSRDLGGYYYQENADNGYELPGIWFNQQELQALLLVQSLAKGFGVLSGVLQPIEQRFTQLLTNNALDATTVANKVRFLGVATREVDNNIFMPLVEATLNSSNIVISYKARNSSGYTEREISPQRIINYRNNWYVDAWCHMRSSLRTFAMAFINEISPGNGTFTTLAEEDIDAYYQSSYGFVSGGEVDVTTIYFAPNIASIAAAEQWHPQQIGRFTQDSGYELSFPFNRDSPQELLKDIMQRGSQVEIIKPAYLREALSSMLKQTLARYA
ncbi:MAG: hypothetical protein COA42_04330 [Alteromonadaceae bacterium]|nr:MAG: hypothetical protein COA42_04330 [Alteromonadaceae bacterium]